MPRKGRGPGFPEATVSFHVVCRFHTSFRIIIIIYNNFYITLFEINSINFPQKNNINTTYHLNYSTLFSVRNICLSLLFPENIRNTYDNINCTVNNFIEVMHT